MICALLSLFMSLNSCGGGEASEATPSPEPTPIVMYSEFDDREAGEPNDREKIRDSSDGKSIWEWRWEQMTGEEFDRETADNDKLVYDHNDRSASCPRGFYDTEEMRFVPYSAEKRAELCG